MGNKPVALPISYDSPELVDAGIEFPVSSQVSTLWANPVWTAPPAARDLVFGIRPQITQFSKYSTTCSGCNGDGCGAGHCSAWTAWTDCSEGGARLTWNAMNRLYTPEGNDFTFYKENCYCSTKPSCTKPDPRPGLLGKGSAGFDPLWRVDWADNTDKDSVLHRVKFSYDISKIDKIDQARRFQLIFDPAPNDESWRRIMQKLCSQRSGACPPDPAKPGANTSCSLVTATANADGSDICKKWFNGLGDENRDAFIEIVCDPSQGPVRTECKCELRSQMPEYQAALGDLYFDRNKISDACIWQPCKSAGSKIYLVNSVDAKPTCPQNLCETVYQVSGTAGSVAISDNQAYLGCSFKPAAGSSENQTEHPENQGTQVPVKPEPPASTPGTSLKLIGWTVMIVLFLGAIVALLWKKKK